MPRSVYKVNTVWKGVFGSPNVPTVNGKHTTNIFVMTEAMESIMDAPYMLPSIVCLAAIYDAFSKTSVTSFKIKTGNLDRENPPRVKLRCREDKNARGRSKRGNL
jgi:hypothetical protein